MEPTRDREPAAAAPPGRLEWALVAASLILHLPFLTEYGWFRDELYYVASTRELAWGYVDHPPLSILLLRAWTGLLGESLMAVRLLPAILGAAAVFLTGHLTGRLGGDRFARILAMLCTLLATDFLFTFHVYSMNALDVLVWTGTAVLLAEILRRRPSRDTPARMGLWLSLGLLLGLGLQNKISVLWFGAGLAAALLLEERRRLRRLGPWLAGGLALALFAPYALWNFALGWPTLEFMNNALVQKMVALDPVSFVGEVILSANPGSLPVWVSGLAWLLISRPGRPWRALAIVWLAVLTILLFAGSSKPGYLAPAFPMLFAAGGVAIESWTRSRSGMRMVVVAPVVALGLALAPFALPMLPPPVFVAYSRTLGVTTAAVERHALGQLPQHFADMHGWQSLVDIVSMAAATLSPAERDRTIVFGQNYGEAGAVDVLGRGLPPAASGHNGYWYWGARGVDVQTVIAIDGDVEDYRQLFESVELAARADCTWCMPYEDDLAIWIARGPLQPFEEIWPSTRHFD